MLKKLIFFFMFFSPLAVAQSNASLAKHACGARKAVTLNFLAQSLEQTALRLERELPTQASTLTKQILADFQEKLQELEARMDATVTSFKNYKNLELQLSYAAAEVAVLRSTLTRMRNAIIASGISTQTLNPLLASAGDRLEQMFQILTEGNSLNDCPVDIVP
ncbi:MAG: hypothetical protein ACOH5I_16055 [Oligoflexus sp.]